MKISNFDDLRAGDRVTISTPQGQTVTGRAQPLLCNVAAGIVILNAGGPHGTPRCCTPVNFVSATRRGKK